jgi:hypothetical protein
VSPTLFLHLSVFLVFAFVSVSVPVTVTVTVLPISFFGAHSYLFVPLIWFTSCSCTFPCLLSRPFPFISVAVHRFVSKVALKTQIVLHKVRTSTLLLGLFFHVPIAAHILIFIPTFSRALAISYMVSLCTVSCSCYCSYRYTGLCPRSCFCFCADLYSHP